MYKQEDVRLQRPPCFVRSTPKNSFALDGVLLAMLATFLLTSVAPLAAGVSVIDTGLAQANGMDYSGGLFWVSENLTLEMRVVKFDPATGMAVGSIPSPVTAWSAARDVVIVGNFIYQPEDLHGNHHIHQFLKSTGANLAEFAHPANFPTGIASGGSFVFVVDNESRVMYKRRLQDLAIVATFPLIDAVPPAGQNGLSYVRGHLYLARESTGIGIPSFVQKIDPETGELLETLGLPASLVNVGGLMDIAYDGRYFWFLFRDNRIYRGPIGFAGVPTSVVVDIKPHSAENPVNLRSRGMIPVAVLTTELADGEEIDFDASQVDPASVTFGPGSAPIAHATGHVEDVDSDGDLDLLLHFRVGKTNLTCDDETARLTGLTFENEIIEGFDSITLIGCR